MKLSSCVHSKLILKISQAKGLRDPEGGCSFEPFIFIVQAGSARGDQGERTGAGAPPVAALGIIGQVASRD